MVVDCYDNLLFLSTSHEMQQRPSYTVVGNTICKGDDRKIFSTDHLVLLFIRNNASHILSWERAKQRYDHKMFTIFRLYAQMVVTLISILCVQQCKAIV